MSTAKTVHKKEDTMEFQSLLLEGNVAADLLRINREQSQRFVNAKLSRRNYRFEHPTEHVWCKCMDGRLNGSVLTRTPLGIISPFRAAGGRFDLGWPYFMEKVAGMVNYATGQGRQCLFFCTYHFSAGKPERGCKAFKFDTNAARVSAFNLRSQYDEAFPGPDREVHAIVVGIETDEDALELHENNGAGRTLRMADLDPAITEDELRPQVRDLYPDMPLRVVNDLLPLLLGNIRHIADVRRVGRIPEELDHREVALCLGRGFSWLHTPNRAIIIGPWEQWENEVAIGGHILLENLQKGRVPQATRPVFMVSAPYRELGTPEHLLAPFKARFLHNKGLEVLTREVPDLVPHLDLMAGTVNMENLLFEKLSL